VDFAYISTLLFFCVKAITKSLHILWKYVIIPLKMSQEDMRNELFERND